MTFGGISLQPKSPSEQFCLPKSYCRWHQSHFPKEAVPKNCHHQYETLLPGLSPLHSQK